jgi:hypothetical protein
MQDLSICSIFTIGYSIRYISMIWLSCMQFILHKVPWLYIYVFNASPSHHLGVQAWERAGCWRRLDCSLYGIRRKPHGVA